MSRLDNTQTETNCLCRRKTKDLIAKISNVCIATRPLEILPFRSTEVIFVPNQNKQFQKVTLQSKAEKVE